MKPKQYKFKVLREPRADGRNSISLRKPIWEMADAVMDAEGYSDFSAFIADLIRKRYQELAREPQQNPEKVQAIADTITRATLRRVHSARHDEPGASVALLRDVAWHIDEKPSRVILGFAPPPNIPAPIAISGASNQPPSI